MQGRIGFVRGDFFLQTFFVWQTKIVDAHLTENAFGLATNVPMYTNNRKNNGCWGTALFITFSFVRQ